MKTISLVDKLLIAAEDPTAISQTELTALLRRAALRIENASETPYFKASWETALMAVAAEVGMSRNDTLTMVLRDWLIGHGPMPVDALDELGEVAGNA